MKKVKIIKGKRGIVVIKNKKAYLIRFHYFDCIRSEFPEITEIPITNERSFERQVRQMLG